MITFLLILSFIFNILAFLFIALLYVRQNRFVMLEKQQKQSVEEVENIIAAFIVEMKEENELFLQKIVTVEKNRQEAPKKEEEEIEELHADFLEKENAVKKIRLSKKQAANVYQKTVDMQQAEKENADELLELILPLEKEETKEKSFFEKVIDLKDQGKKTDEIAKILNKGKTEIELLLKFRQKDEE
ncbi:hypothetical protein [Niallia sp. 01092]|uniref:hypothetical protein n=1 Tax=unclassified Niallia TaxID=2837522 RepID=UPI003FD08993